MNLTENWLTGFWPHKNIILKGVICLYLAELFFSNWIGTLAGYTG